MKSLFSLIIVGLSLGLLSGCVTTVRPLGHDHYQRPHKRVIIKKHSHHHHHRYSPPRKRVVIIR